MLFSALAILFVPISFPSATTVQKQASVGSANLSISKHLEWGLIFDCDRRLPLLTNSSSKTSLVFSGSENLMVSTSLASDEPPWVLFLDREHLHVVVSQVTRIVLRHEAGVVVGKQNGVVRVEGEMVNPGVDDRRSHKVGVQ